MEHNDFDIIEDFDFKPINDGLGFNHKKNSLSETSKKPFVKKNLEKETVYRNVFNEEKPVVTVPTELNAFYAKDSESSRVKTELTFKNEKKIEVNMFIRLVTWILDFSLCASVFIVIHMLMFVSTNLTLFSFIDVLKEAYILPVLSFIFLYNLSYLMRGAGRSFGQSILNVQTFSSKREEGLIKYLILKANFEILGILSGGLLYLLDIDKKLFGDKVVKQ